MFRLSLADARDRQVIRSKVSGMLHKGPAGVLRLAKNGLRLVGVAGSAQPGRRGGRRNFGRRASPASRSNCSLTEGGLAVATRP